MDKSMLGDRMKHNYESVSKYRLTRRMPVIIRLDGCHFHTFCKGMKKPFDDIMVKTMQSVALYLYRNIQGCIFAYTQSDEISLVLIDYKNLESQAWFDYEVQKMASVAASMASAYFNFVFNINVTDLENKIHAQELITDKELQYLDRMQRKAFYELPTFDARCFNVPKEEVVNCIFWRQLDAIRNSILSVGQAHFSHSALQNKSCTDIKLMLQEDPEAQNWEDYPIYLQRGSAVTKIECDWNGHTTWVPRIDFEMPILTGTDRAYLEDLIYVGD